VTKITLDAKTLRNIFISDFFVLKDFISFQDDLALNKMLFAINGFCRSVNQPESRFPALISISAGDKLMG